MSDISFFFERSKKPSFLVKKRMKQWLELVSGSGFEIGSVTFIFSDDDYILEINRKYLDHDYYTDVITFDYTEGNLLSGDIFISLDTVSSNAEKYEVTFEEELYRVMVHGLLHLMGYKDKTEEEGVLMREKENEALNRLKTI